jgi:transcriptional regulator with XRE-family HTH domain
MKLGKLIALYRADHSLSQRQFANICGLSNGYISMLEKGKNPATNKPVTPTIPQLKKLAGGMGMTLMDLLDQADDMSVDINNDEIEAPLHLSGFDQGLTPDLSTEERDLLRKFRCLDERGRSAVLNVLNYEYESLPGEKAGPTPKEA